MDNAHHYAHTKSKILLYIVTKCSVTAGGQVQVKGFGKRSTPDFDQSPCAAGSPLVALHPMSCSEAVASSPSSHASAYMPFVCCAHGHKHLFSCTWGCILSSILFHKKHALNSLVHRGKCVSTAATCNRTKDASTCVMARMLKGGERGG